MKVKHWFSSIFTKSRLTVVGKMVVAFALGILISSLFKLDYVYTAGVIAVLNIESTRKRSLRSGILRFLDSLLALGLASLIFYLLGFEFWVLFIFVIILIPLSFLLKIEGGLIVALVLVSQIYLQQDITFSINAFYILLIGLLVSFILNLYMPNTDKEITSLIKQIDGQVDQLIQAISLQKEPGFTTIKSTIKSAHEHLLADIENHLFIQTDRREAYLSVRVQQIAILERINSLLNKIDNIPQKQTVLDYLKLFKGKIGSENFALQLKEKLDSLLIKFKESALPTTRLEFEYRAELFHVLVEMALFLDLKLEYHKLYD